MVGTPCHTVPGGMGNSHVDSVCGGTCQAQDTYASGLEQTTLLGRVRKEHPHSVQRRMGFLHPSCGTASTGLSGSEAGQGRQLVCPPKARQRGSVYTLESRGWEKYQALSGWRGL